MVNPWGCTSNDYPIYFFVTKFEYLMGTNNVVATGICMAGNGRERLNDRLRDV